MAQTVKNLLAMAGDSGSIPGLWRCWLPTPVCLPCEFHEQRSLADYSSWGHRVGHDWTANTLTFSSFTHLYSKKSPVNSYLWHLVFLKSKRIKGIFLKYLNSEVKWSRSVVSDSLRPHGLQSTRLLHPWNFPGMSTGVGCHKFRRQCQN